MPTRGRSLTRSSRSSRSESYKARRLSMSNSRSASRSSANNLMRTWPLKQGGPNRLPDPFPYSTTAILRYSSTQLFDATTTGTVSHVYSATSIFDPDVSGAGHQPYGRDTYALIYAQYRVKKAIITVTSASTGANAIMGVTQRSSPAVISNYELIRELKATRYTPLANSPNPMKLQLSFDTRADPTREQSTSLMSTSPSDQTYFHVWLTGNGGADPTAVSIIVDITYIVEFFDPINLGSS